MSIMLATAGGAPQKLYVEDVFNPYLQTGNDTARSVDVGIDFASHGGMVWGKARNFTFDNVLFDTVRGATKVLKSNLATAQSTAANSLTAFTSTGFSLGTDPDGYVNANTANYVYWPNRNAPRFFHTMSWTGDGTNPRTMPHQLGCVPGMIIIMRKDAEADRMVWHRSLTDSTYYCLLNTTDAQSNAFNALSSTAPTASEFTVTAGARVNVDGGTYIAYLFAHDTSADGIIQCGSFTTDGSGVGQFVNLGWEPQFVMRKARSTTSPWILFDSMRGMPVGGVDAQLQANANAAEFTNNSIEITPTGFSTLDMDSSSTQIYLAIRRGPMRVPTDATKVFNAIARTGTAGAATVTGVGFAPDLLMTTQRTGSTAGSGIVDRLREVSYTLLPSGTGSEMYDTTYGDIAVNYFTMDGVVFGSDGGLARYNYAAVSHINHFLRRAPGFFDEVCYPGTGANNVAVPHGLGVVPELIIIKNRSNAGSWITRLLSMYTTNEFLWLNSTSEVAADSTQGYSNTSVPTSTAFYVDDAGTNITSNTFVAYLFATCPGVSKVGTYTGNGGTLNIDCGFAAGARFVLIRRMTGGSGAVFVWDTVRGIVAGNDPHISLNSTAAEVVDDDTIDPYAPGFSVNQVTPTYVNVNASTYLYLAIA